MKAEEIDQLIEQLENHIKRYPEDPSDILHIRREETLYILDNIKTYLTLDDMKKVVDHLQETIKKIETDPDFNPPNNK